MYCRHGAGRVSDLLFLLDFYIGVEKRPHLLLANHIHFVALGLGDLRGHSWIVALLVRLVADDEKVGPLTEHTVHVTTRKFDFCYELLFCRRLEVTAKDKVLSLDLRLLELLQL